MRHERPHLTVVGLDISIGILMSLPPPVVVADAVALPVASHHAGVVLAMYMLYHVPDLQAALTEAVRVLIPGGTMIVSRTLATTSKNSTTCGPPQPPRF